MKRNSDRLPEKRRPHAASCRLYPGYIVQSDRFHFPVRNGPENGFVADPAPQHYYNNNPFNVIPDYDFASSLLSGIDSSAAALLVQPAGMTIQENPSEDIAVQPFLTTSDSAF